MTSMLIRARTVFSLACQAMRCARPARSASSTGGSRRSATSRRSQAKKSSTHQAASSIRVLYRRTIICFQSILKGVRAGMNLPLDGLVAFGPHSYWHKVDEEELHTAARIGLVELLLSGTTTAADHH